MNVTELKLLSNLSEREREIRLAVIAECCKALTPYAFTSHAYMVLGRLKKNNGVIE